METDRQQPSDLLVWSVLVLWIGTSLAGLWWFGRAELQPFVVDTAQYRHLVDGTRLPAAVAEAFGLDAGAGQVTLLHIGDPQCRCDRTARRHLERLRSHFADTDLRLVEVAPERARLLRDWLPVQSAPAAVVLDRAGRLTYFGPYGTGVTCLDGDAVQVERALSRALDGSPGSPRLDLLGIGCYCPWPGGDMASASKESIQRT